jgi:hypothetical protein
MKQIPQSTECQRAFSIYKLSTFFIPIGLFSSNFSVFKIIYQKWMLFRKGLTLFYISFYILLPLPTTYWNYRYMPPHCTICLVWCEYIYILVSRPTPHLTQWVLLRYLGYIWIHVSPDFTSWVLGFKACVRISGLLLHLLSPFFSHFI